MYVYTELKLFFHVCMKNYHHHFLSLLCGPQGLDNASPSHFILSHSLHFLPSFPLISSFFFHCAFPGFLRPTSPSLTLRIPTQGIFFSYSWWFTKCVANPGPSSLLYLSICFFPVRSHNSSFVIVSGRLIRRIFRTHLFINACMFLLIFAVLFHVSHPHSKTDLTFDSNIRIFVSCSPYII